MMMVVVVVVVVVVVAVAMTVAAVLTWPAAHAHNAPKISWLDLRYGRYWWPCWWPVWQPPA